MKKEEYYLRLEKALDYVEAHLQAPLSLSAVSESAFSSLSHFHRIFYFMTGLTLKDYIRQRRLSKAGIELINTDRSVLEIALEAQFDSPESFNRSFKKQYQLSPSEFRKLKPEFQVLRKLELSAFAQRPQPPQVSLQFVYLPEQYVLGVKTRTTLENNQQTRDIPEFFGQVMKNQLLVNLPGVQDPLKIFGVYSNMSDEEEFDYTVGLLADPNSSPQAPYCGHQLPAAEYARFSFAGAPQELESVWRYIYGSWMPNSGRSRQRGLDFEIYYPDKTDIYIPMK